MINSIVEGESQQVTTLLNSIYGPAPTRANFGFSVIWPAVPSQVIREGGRVVAYGGSYAEQWMNATGLRRLEIAVSPEHRRRGMGSALLQHLIAACRESGAARVDMRVREDQESGRRFAQQHGFVETERVWELELALGNVEFAPELPAGICITTYGALRDSDPEANRKLHELWCAAAADQPRFDPGGLPPADKFHDWVERETSRIDGWFVALDGEEYVGVCALLQRDYYNDALMQNITGVVRSHRRRGIGKALKLHVLEAARRNGYGRVVTINDNHNLPMLALNEALGFRKSPGWITYERSLAEG